MAEAVAGVGDAPDAAVEVAVVFGVAGGAGSFGGGVIPAGVGRTGYPSDGRITGGEPGSRICGRSPTVRRRRHVTTTAVRPHSGLPSGPWGFDAGRDVGGFLAVRDDALRSGRRIDSHHASGPCVGRQTEGRIRPR